MTPARVNPEQAQAMLDYYDKMGGFDLTWEEIAGVLKQLANMRYEYAVQLQMSDSEWHFTDDELYPFGTPEPRLVQWETKAFVEDLYDSFAEEDGPEHLRIVRRLAGEPEVVE